MNRDYLKQVLLDQKEMFLGNPIVKRDYLLEQNINYCFVGIRQTGKSYMLFQQIRNLMEGGIPTDRILYVNFEDERLLETDTEDLNTILEIGLETAGKGNRPYIFLDEIQNVKGWDKFVRRLADMKYRVNITGSNSRMLSREIASTLGGRFLVLQIYPYSFDEYLRALGRERDYTQVISTSDQADIYRIYEQYVQYGALPGLVQIRNKREYLGSIYQTIYIGDILTRNRITNDFGIRLILKKLAESVTRPVSYNRLANILNSAGASIGKQTVINYIGFIKDAYLLFTIQNYAAKLVEKETAPKYYFMDTGILGLLSINNETALLENLAAIELVRRYGTENVFYFEKNIEVDFVIPGDNLAVQVSYAVLDHQETRKREIGAFVKLVKYLPGLRCLLLTNSEEAELDENGVHVSVLPMWKWLLFKENDNICTD